MNLLTKLNEKFKNIKDETKKRITATILAGGIALSGLGMAGCSSCNPNENNNTNPPIVTPGGDENGGNQGNGNQNGGNQNGSSQTPDYSKYSQVLQNVLTDNYYYSLISNAESHDYDFAYNNQKYQPIPYGFLEDQGFDIDKYKSHQLKCTSELYSINNDLYVELKAEIQASTNYMANYVLKYSLTEKEMDELGKLFSSLYYSTFEDATYYQAPFFVQELSYLKEPEIKSVGYITDASNKNFEEFCDQEKYLAGSHHATYIGSDYIESDVAYHTFQIRPKTTSAKFSSQIGIIKIATIGYKKFNNGNHVVTNNDNYPNGGVLTPTNKVLFEESVQSIISYTSRKHFFKDINNKNELESVFGK